MEAHENPFRVERIEALRYRLAGAGSGGCRNAPEAWVDALGARLLERGGRGALVGPKGRGKTTLLEALGEALARQGYRVVWQRLSRERRGVEWRTVRRHLRHEPARVALLVDGAEQLDPVRWWLMRCLARRVAVLLITVHRPGRLTTLHRHESTPALLQELIRELLAGTNLPPPDDIPALHQQHAGNLRECLRSLYDRYASRP